MVTRKDSFSFGKATRHLVANVFDIGFNWTTRGVRRCRLYLVDSCPFGMINSDENRCVIFGSLRWTGGLRHSTYASMQLPTDEVDDEH